MKVFWLLIILTSIITREILIRWLYPIVSCIRIYRLSSKFRWEIISCYSILRRSWYFNIIILYLKVNKYGIKITRLCFYFSLYFNLASTYTFHSIFLRYNAYSSIILLGDRDLFLIKGLNVHFSSIYLDFYFNNCLIFSCLFSSNN